MTTNTRIRRGSSPAYYLGRPAALWLAAYAPQLQPQPQSTSGRDRRTARRAPARCAARPRTTLR